jgi:hypothetical protein
MAYPAYNTVILGRSLKIVTRNTRIGVEFSESCQWDVPGRHREYFPCGRPAFQGYGRRGHASRALSGLGTLALSTSSADMCS